MLRTYLLLRTYVLTVAHVRRLGVVKDTHLHASVQRRLEELEVQRHYDKHKENPRLVPKLSRSDIVDLVQEMWLGLDHESFARVGYRQTGPTTPMDAEGDAGLYRDILPFWRAMDGHTVRQVCLSTWCICWLIRVKFHLPNHRVKS